MSPLLHPLRIASYNVHRCEGTDGRIDPRRVARVLATLDADVVALQEVDTRQRVTTAASHLDFLAQAAGQTFVSRGPTIAYPGGWYGNAVLARIPVLAVRRLDLSCPGCEPRCALDLQVRHHDRVVRVIAVHLGLDRGERTAQIQRLLPHLSEGDGPLVLIGDFNEWFQHSANLRRLAACLGPSPLVPTFPAPFPFMALDRVWVRPHWALRFVRAHRLPPAQAASDHLPLEVVVEM